MVRARAFCSRHATEGVPYIAVGNAFVGNALRGVPAPRTTFASENSG